MNKEAKSYQSKMTNPFVFWWAMFFKLPSAVFWRLRIIELNLQTCKLSIPFFWRSQNPFRSIYFAALAGAGELTTGALCHLAMAGKGKFSMLVVDFKAEFLKKANEKIIFSCDQGSELTQIIDHMKVGETGKLTMISTGTNKSGEPVARFYITWSFKRKA
ncbi:DUF4442 domain-containing protein [Belliella kenyensis]|uniref:DUF4442 domain-containing protein n=1 Tax=Belliella kenyensis TaxID=1472724 RepID=A0ABV8EMJ5_9BACT|nr:DUF4442 domain-containing protein [Belliella kenyensis]MCH7403540.1 DUF4442 domain-containing protein [Belliella kenyensis]MDN3604938.1 DUF4442 domain-containing protein [Belliella kenyensis]